MKITNKIARAIRQARLDGMTYRAIMIEFNVSEETARKYSSEMNNQKILEYQRKRFHRTKQNPEAYAMLRAQNAIHQRNYRQRQREAEKRNVPTSD